MTTTIQAGSDVSAEKTQIDRIRRRAYALWELEGHAHGRDLAHWLQAERELAGETAGSAAAIEGQPSKRRSRGASTASAGSRSGSAPQRVGPSGSGGRGSASGTPRRRKDR